MSLSRDNINFKIDGIDCEQLNLKLVSVDDNDVFTNPFGADRNYNAETNEINDNNMKYTFNFAYVDRSFNKLKLNDKIFDEIARIFFNKNKITVLEIGDRLYYGKFTKGSNWKNSANNGYFTLDFEGASKYPLSRINVKEYNCNGTQYTELSNISNVDDELYIDIEIVANGNGNISVKNMTNESYMFFRNCVDGEVISIQGDLRQMQSSNNRNLYDTSNATYTDFISIRYGNNKIQIIGNCTVTFKYQFSMYSF